jgi:hypothetical protein
MRKFRFKLPIVLLAAAGTAVLALTVPAPTTAASDIFLRIDGIATTSGSTGSYPNCAILDAIACPAGATGTVNCDVCPPGAPSAGTVNISVETLTTFPSSPCRVKSVHGAFTVSWGDGTSTRATFDGRFRDGKPFLVFSGTVSSSTNPYVSTGQPTKGDLSGFPPNPCVAATNPINGELGF